MAGNSASTSVRAEPRRPASEVLLARGLAQRPIAVEVPRGIAAEGMAEALPEQKAMSLQQAQGLALLPIATAASLPDLPIVEPEVEPAARY